MIFNYAQTHNDKELEKTLCWFNIYFRVTIKKELEYYKCEDACKNATYNKRSILGNPELSMPFIRSDYKKSFEYLKAEKDHLYFEKLSKDENFKQAIKIIKKQQIERTIIPKTETPLIDLQLLLAGIITDALIDYLGLDPQKLVITKAKIESITTKAQELQKEIRSFTAVERALPEDFSNWLDYLTSPENLKELIKNSFYGLKKGRKEGKRELFVRSFCKSFNKYFKHEEKHPPTNLVEQVIWIVDENVDRRTISRYLEEV